jgi:ribosomal protein L37E
MEREHEALGYRERARANKAWGYTHTTQNEACAACGYKERGRERERKQQRERERERTRHGDTGTLRQSRLLLAHVE